MPLVKKLMLWCILLQIVFALPALGYVIKWRYMFLGFMIMLLLVAVGSVKNGTIKWRFFNAPERGTLSVNIAMFNSATRQDTAEALQLAYEALQKVAKDYREEYQIETYCIFLSNIGR